MRKQLKASTRAFMCSKDDRVVDHSTNEQTLQEVLDTKLVFSTNLPGSVSGSELSELQLSHFLGYPEIGSSFEVPNLVDRTDLSEFQKAALDNNKYSFSNELELVPFAMLSGFPESFNPDLDKYYLMDEDEVAPLTSKALSIIKMLKGTGLQEALQLSDNNFVDALGMGISLYSWLGGQNVHDNESLLNWVEDFSSFNFDALVRTTDSSIPKGRYSFDLMLMVVTSTYLHEITHPSYGFVLCSDGSGIRGMRKLWSREINICEPKPIDLSLLKAKSSGNNSKTKSGSKKNDDAVEEEEKSLD